MFLQKYKKHVFYVFYLQITVFNIYGTLYTDCPRGSIDAVAYHVSFLLKLLVLISQEKETLEYRQLLLISLDAGCNSKATHHDAWRDTDDV